MRVLFAVQPREHGPAVTTIRWLPHLPSTVMIQCDLVWGDHVFVEDRTVDVHIRQLRQALQPSGHDRMIETVRGAGYCFRTGAE